MKNFLSVGFNYKSTYFTPFLLLLCFMITLTRQIHVSLNRPRVLFVSIKITVDLTSLLVAQSFRTLIIWVKLSLKHHSLRLWTHKNSLMET